MKEGKLSFLYTEIVLSIYATSMLEMVTIIYLNYAYNRFFFRTSTKIMTFKLQFHGYLIKEEL